MAEVSPPRHVDAMGERGSIQVASPHQRNEVVIAADPIHLSQQVCFEGCQVRVFRADGSLHDERREREGEPEAQ